MIIQINGKNFNNIIRLGRFQKPFDRDLHRIFVQTCIELMRQTKSHYGYCYSDKIAMASDSLLLNNSTIASLATILFYKGLFDMEDKPEVLDMSPIFEVATFDADVRSYFIQLQQLAYKNFLNHFFVFLIFENGDTNLYQSTLSDKEKYEYIAANYDIDLLSKEFTGGTLIVREEKRKTLSDLTGGDTIFEYVQFQYVTLLHPANIISDLEWFQ